MKYYLTLAIASCALLMGCDESEPSVENPARVATKPSAPAVSHPLPGDPVAGKEVYFRICVACHQADGSGLNGMLAANFVADKTRLAKSNEVLLNSIRNGIIADNRVMPPQKDVLTDKEMKDALSYVRNTFGSSK